MTVYVDDARVRKNGRHWNHMAADGLPELHAFASSIGLRRGWFHDGEKHPHYDVTDAQRDMAIARGAKAVDKRRLVVVAKALARKETVDAN